MDQRRLVYCANCGERGHVYRECTGPITSFGIIAFKVVNSREEELYDLNAQLRAIVAEQSDDKSYSSLFARDYPAIKFLLIQRKDTMGYIDFIRGKYPPSEPERTQALRVYLQEMTADERQSLATKTFDQIWDDVWINHDSKTYKNEYEAAKAKFGALDLGSLLEHSDTRWTFQEFGLPKGRRNMKETNVACAEREFCEETGYDCSDYEFVTTYPPVQEDFLGTYGVVYRHVYYLVRM